VAQHVPRWRNLAEMELSFGRSRRRSELRRRRYPRPRRTLPLGWRAILVAAVLFGVVGLVGRTAGLNLSADAGRAAKGSSIDPRCPIPARFRADFAAAARETGLPLALLVAVAEQESRFDPGARSGAGAQGLLQVMPATARELRLDPNVPRSNVLAGARYLRRMLDRFGETDLALAAYNAGPSAVEAAGGAPTVSTLTYVQNVKAAWTRLSVCK
jgi:soluble lytic murein transglycosylase-like protein